MTCMTTKQKFDVEEPTVVVLANGRYAYKVECPWKGKNDKQLFAFKFCGADAYESYMRRTGQKAATDDEQEGVVAEQSTKGEQ